MQIIFAFIIMLKRYRYTTSKLLDVCKSCFAIGKKIGEGGHSEIYQSPDDPNILIRMIHYDKTEYGQIRFKNEILLSLFTSALVDNQISPNFILTYGIFKCGKNLFHHIIEKFDGDLSTQKFKNVDNFIQGLISIYVLMNHNFMHGDIKPENILYKILPYKITLTYKFDGGYYKLPVKILISLSDYGLARRYKETKSAMEVDHRLNIRDILSMCEVFGYDIESLVDTDITNLIFTYRNSFKLLKIMLKKLLYQFRISDEQLSETIYDIDKKIPLISADILSCQIDDE